MNGRPFRIAAAGLGAALVASIVAGFSHFRTESRLLARSEKISVPISTVVAATAPPLADLNAREVVAEALPSTRRPAVQRPAANVVSNIRRKKEFVELPPPPEFLDEPEPTVQLAVAPPPARTSDVGDPRLLAEIAMLRRDLERLNDQQKLEREFERDRHARELATIATEHRLSELKSSVDELKSLHRDGRIAMLQTEPPMPVLERPAPPPLAVSESEPSTPPADRSVQVLESPVSDHFEFRFEGTDLQAALSEIGRRASMNLVISPDVEGVVTASWKNVTPQEAIEALKLAHGLSVEPQGSFILVSTSKEARGRAEHSKNTLVQMFRPLYISGRDLLPLIEPLLTPEIGRIAVTLPQSSKEADRIAGGADSLAQPDALIVVDFPEVIEVVTRTIAEVDVPAPHVELEATILDVQLSGRVKNGVGALIANGEFSNRPGFASLDDPQMAMPCDSCCQTCDMSCSEVVEKLKLWTDVKLVSNARLLVLNKQPAELQVGSESLCLLPHGGTMPTAAVDGGMRLCVRPFVSADHLVRLEVSPEAITSRSQPMNTRRETFASVATNVAVPNGGSLVIAGLNVDQSVAPSAIFDSFGRLRKKHRDTPDRAIRREIVIMVTPRVVQNCGPTGCVDGTPGMEAGGF